MTYRFLLSTVLVVSASPLFCAAADFAGSSSPFTVEHTTQVPGDSLKAGTYSISIVEQIADRMIVRIDSTTSTNHSIFLGVPSTATKIGGNAGAVTWSTGVNKTPTLRGFIFPSGNTVEFVYPKAEAAALAKGNSAAVVAVDPESEGRVALKSLSKDELNIVNLWLLSLTSTGPNNTPAVLARHYDATQDLQHPTVASGVAPAYPTGQRQEPSVQAQTAIVVRPPVPTAPVVAQQVHAVTTLPKGVPQGTRAHVARADSSSRPDVAKLEEPAMPKPAVRPARQTPMISQLPHTASFLPAVWMLGLLSLFATGLLRLRRLRTTRGVVR